MRTWQPGWQFTRKSLILLAVLLGTAAPLLAQSAPDGAKWEKDIQAFESADRTNPPPKGAVLFVGSSSIRLWKTLAEDFPRERVINRGFGGSQIRHATAFAERIVLPHAPTWIVLYAGDNDINAGRTPEQVREDFEEFGQQIHRTLPEARIAFISIKPSIARWQLAEPMKVANHLIEEFCRRDPRLRYIDIFEPMLGDDGKPRKELFVQDGLHLSAAGYALWASRLGPVLAHGEE